MLTQKFLTEAFWDVSLDNYSCKFERNKERCVLRHFKNSRTEAYILRHGKGIRPLFRGGLYSRKYGKLVSLLTLFSTIPTTN